MYEFDFIFLKGVAKLYNILCGIDAKVVITYQINLSLICESSMNLVKTLFPHVMICKIVKVTCKT